VLLRAIVRHFSTSTNLPRKCIFTAVPAGPIYIISYAYIESPRSFLLFLRFIPLSPLLGVLSVLPELTQGRETRGSCTSRSRSRLLLRAPLIPVWFSFDSGLRHDARKNLKFRSWWKIHETEESRGAREEQERTTALCFHDGSAESILVYVTTKPPSQHDVTFGDHIDFPSCKLLSALEDYWYSHLRIIKLIKTHRSADCGCVFTPIFTVSTENL